MARTVSIGNQNFESLVSNHYFYVDKTDFIREWWENADCVTVITRPRRFGKTLNMNMVERFFSVEYAGQGELFAGLGIWQEETYRRLQGTVPVIGISFADIKENDFASARKAICHNIKRVYRRYDFLLETELLSEEEKKTFRMVSTDMENYLLMDSIRALSEYLFRCYGEKPIILLDEYDTPMQEAYVWGYWKEIAQLMRGFFNSTFKTNPYLGRALMTGITRMSRESIFSDLNNLEVVTTTKDKYADAFGFTQQEVSAALGEFGLSDMEAQVRDWYDGFTFGSRTDIYNPWSIINYLDEKRFSSYWANTSENSLVGKLIRESGKNVKLIMENLLKGEVFRTEIDEQIVFDRLDHSETAIFSLLLAGGYLRVAEHRFDLKTGREQYALKLTNREVHLMFERMIEGWFKNYVPEYNDFIRALLLGDVEEMNYYMNGVALATFSYFDTGNSPSGRSEPERFYHGFVLGLMVELSDRYIISSNRESGFGRYDVMLEPKSESDDAILMEFKVRRPNREKSLEETAAAALAQIAKKRYADALAEKGIAGERIHTYGFAFEGKTVLIDGR